MSTLIDIHDTTTVAIIARVLPKETYEDVTTLKTTFLTETDEPFFDNVSDTTTSRLIEEETFFMTEKETSFYEDNQDNTSNSFTTERFSILDTTTGNREVENTYLSREYQIVTAKSSEIPATKVYL